ncbi:AI-2E family transporter, partial [Arthrobacter deserti]|nr:AI-2E family transporter [Arthrobacter deserti]
VIAVIVVVNQLEGNFLQPVVMGNTLNIHPLVILLALTAGSVLAGIIGAVLSVPLAAVTWAVIKIWTGGKSTPRTRAKPVSARPAGDRAEGQPLAG